MVKLKAIPYKGEKGSRGRGVAGLRGSKLGRGKKGKAAAWVAPGIEPFTQGELDGLCGIYAVINAYRLLWGDDFTHERAARLFKRMAKAAPLAVFDGLTYHELLDLIALANRAVPAKLRLEVRHKEFRKPANGPAWRVDTYIKKLREEVNEGGQVAILGIQKAFNHFTLIHRVTPSTIKLTDSESMSHLRLDRCGVTANTRRDLWIMPSQTVLLRPWALSPNDLRKRARKRAT
ncbi:MAG: hypothetical protein GC129_06935 [Proteobacteria bacterium]|nr:hypothetical protein [Pseudomonadota bacterium]